MSPVRGIARAQQRPTLKSTRPPGWGRIRFWRWKRRLRRDLRSLPKEMTS